MLRWVFFDLGGTLLDDLSYHDHIYRTMVRIFAEHGFDVTMDEFYDMLNVFVKKRVPVLKSLIEHFTRDPSLVDPLFRELMNRIAGRGPELQSPFPEAQSVIENLRRRHELGIIANQEVGVRSLLTRVGWDRIFKVIIISDEVKLWKPDARIFLLALDEAGCEPSEAAMVGDRVDNDVAPAKRLGMKTVRFKWGIFGPQEASSEDEKPDLEILSLSDAPDAVERL